MKTRFAPIVSFLLVADASSAADPEPQQNPHPAFDRLKKLRQEWTNTTKGKQENFAFDFVRVK